jgi:asparagine synthase (glutamine-hydrolysing)
MPEIYDEPIADISILPTYLVSKNARRYVKAVMSGEGADELLGGYNWQKDWYKKNSSSWKQRFLHWDHHDPIQIIDFYADAMSMGSFTNVETSKLINPHYHTSVETDRQWYYKKHFRKDLTSFQAIQLMDIKCFMGELVLTKIDSGQYGKFFSK